MSRYLYAIIISTILAAAALIGVRLISTRAYKRRTILFMSALIGSFVAAFLTLVACFAHWFSMGYGGLFHIICDDVVLSVVHAVCTTWIVLISASFSYAILRGTISYYLGGKVVARFFHVSPLSKNDAKNLHKTLESLSRKAGVNAPEIGLISSSRPAIFSVGRKQKSTIVVSVGLLETLSNDEIAASLAHEIYHIKNKDHLVKSLASSLKFAVPFGPIGYLIEPAISRDREFLADQESVKLTRKPKALVSALMKLYQVVSMNQGSRLSPSFPASFLAPTRYKWRLFSMHPPITERVKRLFELENEYLQSAKA
ncbi:MAG TPA: M48 family metallopeptidase [Candidatus Bathyarchaeia archaeon]